MRLKILAIYNCVERSFDFIPHETPWGKREIFHSMYKNSSGDEIANVLVNDDIAHT